MAIGSTTASLFVKIGMLLTFQISSPLTYINILSLAIT